jgi:hypothetical protein
MCKLFFISSSIVQNKHILNEVRKSEDMPKNRRVVFHDATKQGREKLKMIKKGKSWGIKW